MAAIWGFITRRWLVFTCGVLLVAGAGLVIVAQDGQYWSRTSIIFLAPSSARYPNSLQTKSDAMIVTAGIVAIRINGTTEPPKYASTDATLVGIPPLDRPYWLRLPDSGGQWAHHFANQELLLDVVGSTAEEVEEIREEVIAQVRLELYELQREHDVDPIDDITIKVAQDPPATAYVHGSRVRALGMTALLGLSATIVVATLIDRRASRTSTRRAVR